MDELQHTYEYEDVFKFLAKEYKKDHPNSKVSTIELKKIIRFVMHATATQDDFAETYENRKEIFKER